MGGGHGRVGDGGLTYLGGKKETFPPSARLGKAHRGGLKRKQSRGFGLGVWPPGDLRRDARRPGCDARRGKDGDAGHRRRAATLQRAKSPRGARPLAHPSHFEAQRDKSQLNHHRSSISGI
jgi:hypothetical protein